jgi:hypothetical protein
MFDDSVKRCPNCETPNQFGETCARCIKEEQNEIDYHRKLDQEMLEKSFNEDYYKDQPEYFGDGYDPSEYIYDDGDDPLLENYY